MTVRTARAALSLVWLLAMAPLVLQLVYRSAVGFYKGDIIELWSWMSQLLFPVVALIISSWSVEEVQGDTHVIRSPFVFWGALLLSVMYIGSLYLVVIVEPLAENDWVSVFRSSGVYLGFIQGIVVLALGKFFIENVR